jgi:molybdopterin-guanine dinucleotide biosynthesis protein
VLRRRAGVKIIAVAGSASGSGKTRVACDILRAIPGLGAVKISPREVEPRLEWGPGAPGKDTARYAASGAAVIARVVAPRGRVPAVWEGMREALDRLPGVIVEGAGAVALPAERFTVFVAAAETLGRRPERDRRLASAADFIVFVHPGQAPAGWDHPAVSLQRGRIPVLAVTPDLETWAGELLLDAIRRFLSESASVRRESVPKASVD